MVPKTSTRYRAAFSRFSVGLRCHCGVISSPNLKKPRSRPLPLGKCPKKISAWRRTGFGTTLTNFITSSVPGLPSPPKKLHYELMKTHEGFGWHNVRPDEIAQFFLDLSTDQARVLFLLANRVTQMPAIQEEQLFARHRFTDGDIRQAFNVPKFDRDGIDYAEKLRVALGELCQEEVELEGLTSGAKIYFDWFVEAWPELPSNGEIVFEVELSQTAIFLLNKLRNGELEPFLYFDEAIQELTEPDPETDIEAGPVGEGWEVIYGSSELSN